MSNSRFAQEARKGGKFRWRFISEEATPLLEWFISNVVDVAELCVSYSGVERNRVILEEWLLMQFACLPFRTTI